MGTVIRANISRKNKYWINKHRYHELKHFCLQYPEWKRIYVEFDNSNIVSSSINILPSSNLPGDPTANRAIIKAYYADRIKLLERIALETDSRLCNYILKAVTEGYSYTYLKTRLEIPCGRDMYYDRYRKFFWLLNESRG